MNLRLRDIFTWWVILGYHVYFISFEIDTGRELKLKLLTILDRALFKLVTRVWIIHCDSVFIDHNYIHFLHHYCLDDARGINTERGLLLGSLGLVKIDGLSIWFQDQTSRLRNRHCWNIFM
jgi:hypothetical protein